MKTIHLIIVAIVVGLFSSCKTGFYSQKFTNLKPLKAPIEKTAPLLINQIDVSTEDVEEAIVIENEIALLSEEDEKQIKAAIEKELPIYVVSDQAIYKVVNPSYDQFYNAIAGDFQIVNDQTYLQEDHLELFQNDFSPSKTDPFIYINNILSVLSYSVSVNPNNDAEPKENRVDSSKTNSESTLIPQKGDGSRVSLAEHNSSKYVVKQRRYSIIAGVSLVFGVVLVVAAFSLGSFAAVLLLGLFAVGLYLTALIAIIGALMSNQRNRVAVQKRGYKVNQKANFSAVGLWIVLIFMSLSLLLIPVLIALIAVACI